MQGINAQWSPDEIKFDRDYMQLSSLDANGRHTSLAPILYFLESDNNIVEYLSENVVEVYKDVFEISRFYDWKKFNEGIHAITYESMFMTLIPDSEERNRLRESIRTIQAITNKYDWLTKMNDGIEHVEQAHIINLNVEGIHFASSFKYFQTLQVTPINNIYLFPGACRANELIMKDESLHTIGEANIYNMSSNPLDENDVHAYFKRAIQFEFDFIDYMLPNPFGLMTRENMYENAKLNCNSILSMINVAPLFDDVRITDGLVYSTGIVQKTSFFEADGTEYTKGIAPTYNDMDSESF
jgi:ribonucleotide reductase beta subunit family protein with ferritin-like domain